MCSVSCHILYRLCLSYALIHTIPRTSSEHDGTAKYPNSLRWLRVENRLAHVEAAALLAGARCLACLAISASEGVRVAVVRSCIRGWIRSRYGRRHNVISPNHFVIGHLYRERCRVRAFREGHVVLCARDGARLPHPPARARILGTVPIAAIVDIVSLLDRCGDWTVYRTLQEKILP